MAWILLFTANLLPMNRFVYSVFLSFLVVFCGNAQELSSYEQPVEERRLFRIGFSINGILNVNPGSSPSQGLTWFDHESAYVIDFARELDYDRKWLVGFSFGFQRLAWNLEVRNYFPEEYLSGAYLDGTSDFSLFNKYNASTYSSLIYSEYDLVELDRFIGFARVETGATVYRSNARITYKDVSGHNQVPVSNREAGTSFNAGFGLGVKYEREVFGLKLALIYQAQTRVRFRSREEYLNYAYDFDASTYDFRGAPDDSKFTISESGDRTGRRYSPLYIQLGIYFPIGGSLE
jgi:hypothetical protein